MRNKKIWYLVGLVFACGIITLGIIGQLNQKTRRFIGKELAVSPIETSFDTSELVYICSFKDPKGQNYVYLADHSGSLSISAMNLETGQSDTVYTSDFDVTSYDTFQIDQQRTLLLVNYKKGDLAAFDIVGLSKAFNSSLVYSDYCDSPPYIALANLNSLQPYYLDKRQYTYLDLRVLLNYDFDGRSNLILLNEPLVDNIEHTHVASGQYIYFDEGDLAIGKRIISCGGFGDYIYYQAVYNQVGDPHPDVVNFQSHGRPVLYRYAIATEQVLRVGDLDKFATHINAGGSTALVSEYDYFNTLPEAVKLISLSNFSNFFLIPDIGEEEIEKSLFITADHLVFSTADTLFFTDLDKHSVYTYDIKDCYSLHLGSEGASFAKDNSGGGVTLYEFFYDAVFP